MIKLLGSVVPFLIFHLFCCGALLGMLITTGYLYLFSQEGERKTLFLPTLGLAILFFWLHRHHSKCCEEKGEKTITDHVISVSLYLFFSLLFGLIFIIYFFIPWWIPNYQGGILLP